MNLTYVLRSSALALLALVVAAGSVFAQDAPGQRGRGDRGRFSGGSGFGGLGSAMLLRVEKVQTELKLTADQQAKVKEIQDAARKEMGDLFSGIRDLPEDQRRAKFAEMREKGQAAAKATAEKIDGVLTTEQKARLEQITLQQRGTSALADPKIAESLGLSAEQKTKITDIYGAQREMMQEMFAGGQDLSREERAKKFNENREKMQELRTETDKAVLEVLTADQKSKFEASQGAKFELDRSELFSGFGGRRRGGDNNNNN